MPEPTSAFTPDDNMLHEMLQPIATGSSTCDCFLLRRYGKRLFMKRLKPKLATHPQYRAALQKEFEVGYTMEHPHLARYVDKGDDYLLMEYVDGQTLAAFVKEQPDYFRHRKHLDRFVRQLLDVVGYLHRHHVVHLDLKPQNILLRRQGNNLCLIDLGYCYTDSYPDTTGRTDDYAAPEQFDAHTAVDQRADIYAIGKVLSSLTRARICIGVSRRCTMTDPRQRFQTIDNIVAYLRRHRLQRLWGRVVAALFAIAIVICGILMLPPSSSDNKASSAGEPPVLQQDDVRHVVSYNAGESTSASGSAGGSPAIGNTPSIANDASTSEETPPQTGTRSAPTQIDVANLHLSITVALLPVFNQYLGQYRHADYYSLTQPELEAFGKQSVAYDNAAIFVYRSLWNQYSTTCDKTLFDAEWEKVQEELRRQLFQASGRNG